MFSHEKTTYAENPMKLGIKYKFIVRTWSNFPLKFATYIFTHVQGHEHQTLAFSEKKYHAIVLLIIYKYNYSLPCTHVC